MTEPDVVAQLRRAGCVFAEDEARLLLAAAATPAELTGLVDRRVGGEPLEHVLGWVEFHGQRLRVGPGVFVPRQRTGLLVDRAVVDLGPAPTIVELCCGVAAVAAVLAALVPTAEVHAADLDPVAVGYAAANLGPDRVYCGDLYQPLPARLRGRVDVLIANAPYVPSASIALMPPEAREYEPRIALDGGADGLAVLRRVTAAAAQWLAPGGRLLFEIGRDQRSAALSMVAEHGLTGAVTHDPDRGATVLTARLRTVEDKPGGGR